MSFGSEAEGAARASAGPPSPRPNPADPGRPSQNLAPRAPRPLSEYYKRTRNSRSSATTKFSSATRKLKSTGNPP
eukprot:scaffold16594_cov124-Isochrysis_galbana.AAC.1